MSSNYCDDEIIDVLGDHAIYLRKSRADMEAEARGEGETLSRHRKTLMELANKRNIKIGKIYKEIVSGDSISQRPKVQQLLNDVRCGMWKGVLVVEIERLARGDTEDQGIVAKAFKISSTNIITPMKTFNPNNEFDEEYFEFGLFMSRREYKTIKRRMQNGRVLSVLEGKYVGSIAPFGYDRLKLQNQKGYTLTENEETKTAIEMFKIFAYNDISINEVTRIAKIRGLKPRNKEVWSRSTLKDMYRNPVYIGMIKWNYRKEVKVYKNGEIVKTRPRNDKNDDYILVKGLHKPIIDKKTWDIVQEKLKRNAPSVVHNDVIKNPLVGLIYCAKCGRLMQRRPYKKANTETGLICTNPNCDNIGTKLKIVEDKIISAMREWLKSYKLNVDDYINDVDKDNLSIAEGTLKNLESQFEKQKKKIENVYNFFEDGTYTKEMFNERILILNSQKNEIEENIKKQRKLVDEQYKRLNDKKEVIPQLENIIDLYPKLETAEEKNLLLKTVLKKAVYKKDKRAVGKNADPTDFYLDIYPNVSKVI